MRLSLIAALLLLLSLLSCCGPACEKLDKHQYKIGEIVKHRLNQENKFIIQDTTRSYCEPEYYVEDSNGDHSWIVESSLTR